MSLRLGEFGDLGECESCYKRRLRAVAVCERCGLLRRPSASRPGCCERCAGEEVRHVCDDCGVEGVNHTDGRCARCTLREILRRLRADGDPVAISRLEPYLQALAAGPRPWTALKWMVYSRGYETVIELACGARELSHEGLDGLDRGMTTSFLRAALVSHGVLAPRAEQTAKLANSARHVLACVPTGEGRAHVRAFATWQVQHDLARRERHGQATRKSAANSIRLVRAAAELTLFTQSLGLTLAELRQEQLDRWLESGSTATRHIRPFLKWAIRGRLIAPLTAPPPTARSHTEPLASETRLRLVRRLLEEEGLDLRDRVGGCLILLYAQPLSRILMLTSDRVSTTGGRVVIHLGRTPLELPEPLGALTARLAHERRGRASTAKPTIAPPWLFQGMRIGEPLDETYFRRRLKRLGIMPLTGRTAALITLAAAMPPTILADLLGISESAATKWYQLAGGEWGRYAADATRRYDTH